MISIIYSVFILCAFILHSDAVNSLAPIDADEAYEALPQQALDRIYYHQVLQHPTLPSLLNLLKTNKNVIDQVLESRNQKIYWLMPDVILELMKSNDHLAILRRILAYPKLVDWRSAGNTGTDYIMNDSDMIDIVHEAFGELQQVSISSPARQESEITLESGKTLVTFIKRSIQSLHGDVPEPIFNYALLWSSHYGADAMIKFLLTTPPGVLLDSWIYNGLNIATASNRVSTVDLILQALKNSNGNGAFISLSFLISAFKGHVEIGRMILSRFSIPEYHLRLAALFAGFHEHSEYLKMLHGQEQFLPLKSMLPLWRFQAAHMLINAPEAEQAYVFQIINIVGDVDILKAFHSHMVDASFYEHAMHNALAAMQPVTVNAILELPGVSFTPEQFWIITDTSVCQNLPLDTLIRLINFGIRKEYLAESDMSKFFLRGAEYGNTKIVLWLWDHFLINDIDKDRAFIYASGNGHKTLAKEFLRHGLPASSDEFKVALYKSSERNQFSVTQLLLSDSRVLAMTTDEITKLFLSLNSTPDEKLVRLLVTKFVPILNTRERSQIALKLIREHRVSAFSTIMKEGSFIRDIPEKEFSELTIFAAKRPIGDFLSALVTTEDLKRLPDRVLNDVFCKAALNLNFSPLQTIISTSKEKITAASWSSALLTAGRSDSEQLTLLVFLHGIDKISQTTMDECLIGSSTLDSESVVKVMLNSRKAMAKISSDAFGIAFFMWVDHGLVDLASAILVRDELMKRIPTPTLTMVLRHLLFHSETRTTLDHSGAHEKTLTFMFSLENVMTRIPPSDLDAILLELSNASKDSLELVLSNEAFMSRVSSSAIYESFRTILSRKDLDLLKAFPKHLISLERTRLQSPEMIGFLGSLSRQGSHARP